MSLAVPRADVDLARLSLFLACNDDVIELLELSISYLLVERNLTGIDFDVEPSFPQLLIYFVAIILSLLGHWADDNLPRREPERPLAAQVLSQNGEEALDRPKDGSVDHHWPRMTRLQRLLFPFELLFAILIWFENLGG